MQKIILLAFGCFLSLCLSAQSTNYFFKTLDAQRGATLCPDRAGNMWMATRAQGRALLIKTSPNGTVLDRVYLHVSSNFGEASNVVDLLIDSENMIVGCGNMTETFSAGFVFRYNPATRTLLWINRFETLLSSISSSVMERGSGGHFTLVSSGLFGESELLTFDRQTGDLLPTLSNAYSYGMYNAFNAGIWYKNNIYVAGMDDVEGAERVRTSISRIQPADGKATWTALSPQDFLQYKAEFIAQDIIADQDSLVTVSLTGPQASGTLLTHTIMQKNTLDGDLVWAKRYVLFSPAERNSVVVEEVVATSDGYVLFGRTYDDVAPRSSFFLIKTDKSGNPKWARLLGKNWDVDIYFLPYDDQVVATANALYVLTDANIDDNTHATVLFKTDLSGQIEGCDYIQNISVQAIDIVNPVNEFVEYSQANVEMFTDQLTVTPEAGAAPNLITYCEKVASCVNKPDAVVQLDSITCGDGQRTLHYSLCNAGTVALRGDLLIGLYPQNPLTDTTTLVDSWTLSTDSLPAGECLHLAVPFDSLELGQLASVYVLAGAIEAPTPLQISQFPFGANPEECDYANNLGTWKLDVKGTAPQLGDDQSICAGEVVVLQAGSSTSGFVWQDGSMASTLTASATGLYWVEIGDECGIRQRDSVQVTLLPTPTDTRQVTLVQGSSIVIGGVTYTQADTVTLLVPASNGGCDSLITYQIVQVPVQVNISCPANIVATIPPGQNTVAIAYSLPTATTNCPLSGMTLVRLQGAASGALLGEGISQVCYGATDTCAASASCCFTVTVEKSTIPCEVKEIGCIRYELFPFFQNPQGLTYRIRVVNDCASTAQTFAFQLPAGSVALSPLDGTQYTAPSGRKYDVRNSNASPFYSIRFRSKTGGLPAGQSDYFEYVLPIQSTQAFVLAYTRLNTGATYESYLNITKCLSGFTNDLLMERTGGFAQPDELAVIPNPTAGVVQMLLPADWLAGEVRVTVLNLQGQTQVEGVYLHSPGTALVLDLDESLPNGLYHVVAQHVDGQRVHAPCVLERR